MARRHPISQERSLSRKRPKWQPRERFLLLFEGRKTEPKYFERVRVTLRDSLITIELGKERGDPLALVQAALAKKNEAEGRARREKDAYLRYDQVWCVLDVDDHARLPAARALAARNSIKLAVSNPCFELWALLHFDTHSSHISPEHARRKLERYMPEYNKALDCSLLKGKYKAAKRRAVELAKQHERNGLAVGSNPSTDVWILIDSLLESARAAHVKGDVEPI